MRLGYRTLCSTLTIVIRVQILLSPRPVFSLEIVAPLNEQRCVVPHFMRVGFGVGRCWSWGAATSCGLRGASGNEQRLYRSNRFVYFIVEYVILIPIDSGLCTDSHIHEPAVSTRIFRSLSLHQVNFLSKSRAEGRRGILRSTTTSRARDAGTTSLAGRFAVPSVAGRAEYTGGSDAERTGGRRKRCLSLRAD